MDPNTPNTYNHYDVYFQDDRERYVRGYGTYEQFLAIEAGGSGLGSAPKRTRTYIPRQREEAKQRLIEDYFGDDETPPKYPEENFRRIQRDDAAGRLNIGPILKCTSVIRQLVYDTAPDAFDEYLQIAERYSRQCLENFAKCKYILYVENYLRKPTSTDIKKTYALHEEIHGLPRMVESIDCMHWEWRNWPKSLHGQFKRRDRKYPTLMLETVAD
ncbi:protein arginine N-methyltransferase 1.6, partial [Tanacetum coccineum]